MEALIPILPFALLFLLCPLMMLFMHRGHGDHAHSRQEPRARAVDRPASGTGEGPASQPTHH